jgi:2-hydroxy-6-oxonona-2,4-dienedioate hydrolase
MLNRQDEPAYRAAEAKLFDAYGVDPTEHWVEVPELGTRIRVLETGEGEPVLFLHGSPNAAATWIPLTAGLPDRRCLMVERPGAGLSEPVKRWRNHRKDVAKLLETVLDAVGCDSADVVGCSFGGLYAYALALESPARVRSIVQMGAPAGPVALPMPPIFRVLSIPVIPLLAGSGMRPDPEKARAMTRDIGHGPSIDRDLIPGVLFEWYSSVLCRTNTLLHLLGEIRAIATPFGLRKAAAISDVELGEIEQPLLYLWGDHDIFATPQEAEHLCSLTRGAAIERFPDAGHLPWFDDPEGVAERLRAFCANTARTV